MQDIERLFIMGVTFQKEPAKNEIHEVETF